MKKTDFNIEIAKEKVLRSIGVQEDSELYEEILDELEELLPIAKEKIKPVALLGIGALQDPVVRDGKDVREALYALCSIGKGMEQMSSRYFAEGDYLKGMLSDAIADDYLFQMDEQLEPVVIEMCRKEGMGILGRAEIPKDLPLHVQKTAFTITNAEEEGIEIKESFMYDPVKTMCNLYLLDEEKERFQVMHDCSRCDNFTCKRRRQNTVNVVVHVNGEKHVLLASQKESLLTTCQKHQIFLPAICSGRGNCGKCKVRVLSGCVTWTEKEEQYFSEEEKQMGWHLACCIYPKQDCEIVIEHAEDCMYVVANEEEKTGISVINDQTVYAIAADIGTTTIAMQLVDLATGKAVDTYTAINKQRSFGADVISRIEASNQGNRAALRANIQKDILDGINALTNDGQITISKMVIGANTTMVHLLLGLSCETLGVYPFAPVTIETIHSTAEEVLGISTFDFPIIIFPGISTYVGGDIVAGLYELDFHRKKGISVLIDLGTNGEMAIGNQERILVASTAAGPAFEGGNIVCGTGSIPGAICNVSIGEENQVTVKTIRDQKPSGICGTGVLECTSELLKAELIDETGLMDEEIFDDGLLLDKQKDIRFYQKDVREIQLAKSAVRAGLETLILRFGVTCDEIEKIYIAGGFGYKINVEKAIEIGLFPEECKEKIVAIGNSCLKGVKKSLIDPEAEKIWNNLCAGASEIELSADKKFQEFYVEYMLF